MVPLVVVPGDGFHQAFVDDVGQAGIDDRRMGISLKSTDTSGSSL
jgi:hypothetical protein